MHKSVHWIPRCGLLALGFVAGGVLAQSDLPFPRSVIGGVPTLAGGDIDDDGDIDFVGLYRDGSDRFYVAMVNDGEGRFEKVVFHSIVSLTPPQSVPAGEMHLLDMDADGDLDFVVRSGSSDITIFDNDGFGGFTEGDTHTIGFGSMMVGDLDGDQYPDIVTLRSANTYVFMNNGNGGFAPGVAYYNEVVGHAHLVDLDGDADLDVVGTTYGELYRILNNGNGTFGSRRMTASSIQIEKGIPIELSGDGRPDFVVFDEFTPGIVVHLNNGSGNFGAPVTISGDQTFDHLTTADFDNDGDDDLIARNVDGEVYWYRNQQNGSLDGPFMTGVHNERGTHVAGPYAADVDGNGVTDLVSVVEGRVPLGGGLILFAMELVSQTRNEQGSYLGAEFVPFESPRIYYNAHGDLNGDGLVDMVGEDYDDRYGVYVRLSQGNGQYAPPQRYEFSYLDVEYQLGDYDSDGDLDLFVTLEDLPTAHIAVMRNDGSGQFGLPENLVTTTLSFLRYDSYATGDVDGDGVLDLVLKRMYTGSEPEVEARLEIRLGDGAGGFTIASNEELPGMSITDVRLFDQDSDGDLDVFLRGRFIEIGPGGTQISQQTIDTDQYFLPVDLDQDGWGDVVSSEGGLSILWGEAPGGFAGSVQQLSELLCLRFLVTDHDGDGHLDLLATYSGGHPESAVGLFRGDGSRMFDDRGRFGYCDAFRPLHFEDRDGDGENELWVEGENGYWKYSDSASVCLADLNYDGVLNFFDISLFLNAYNASDPIADFNGDGVFNFFDVSLFLNAYNAGCP